VRVPQRGKRYWRTSCRPGEPRNLRPAPHRDRRAVRSSALRGRPPDSRPTPRRRRTRGHLSLRLKSGPSLPGRSGATRRKHPRWRFLSVGAVVAVAISLVGSGTFAFYVSRFGSYNKTPRLTVGGRRDADLALAERRCSAPWCRGQRGSRTRPRASTARTRPGRPAGTSQGIGLIATLAGPSPFIERPFILAAWRQNGLFTADTSAKSQTPAFRAVPSPAESDGANTRAAPH